MSMMDPVRQATAAIAKPARNTFTMLRPPDNFPPEALGDCVLTGRGGSGRAVPMPAGIEGPTGRLLAGAGSATVESSPRILLAGVHFAMPSRQTMSGGLSCPDLPWGWS